MRLQHFCILLSFLGYVHTKPDKFGNATFFIRIGLPSTLKRCFRCPETELFENALQSGEIWKPLLSVLVWTAKTELFENADVTTAIWL